MKRLTEEEKGGLKKKLRETSTSKQPEVSEKAVRNYLSFIIVGLAIILLGAIIYPSFVRFNGRAKVSEATQNLAAIRTAEASYFAENNVYLECKPSPPNGGMDAKPDKWIDAGGFDEIGFAPDDKVKYQYAVAVSEDGRSFVATATGDLDEDGKKTVFTVDTRASTYPKSIRTGDDY